MTLAAHLYRRLMRRGRVISLLALSSIPGMIYWLTSFDADPARLEASYADVITTTGFSFAIATLILTVATLREERDAGTLPYIYMRPISRETLAIASMAAAIAAASTVALGGWLVSFLAVLAVGGHAGIALPGLVQFLGAAIGYSALFVPLGYTAPRATIVGLVYVVVVESILGSAIEAVAHLSIWRMATSIYADVAGALGGEARELLGPVEVGVGVGVVKLSAILIAGLAVLVWALRRRDAL